VAGLAAARWLEPGARRAARGLARPPADAGSPEPPRWRRRIRAARPGRETRGALSPDLLWPLLSRADRLVVAALTGCWLVAVVAFWAWLLRPEHRTSALGVAVSCLLLGYLSTMPVYFLLAVNRLRGVTPMLDPGPLRVALVTTKAPSEPWDVVRRTLEAMLGQRYPYPYDVWLCDEDPAPQVLDWCVERGIRVSTRRESPEYHRAVWPRRTRCKEGNLAYFYDHWGYRDYDVVAQLDCDHVPAPGYLLEMVRPFVDPVIGYVAAPSICDSNATASWAARGRLFAEASFHGPLQAGHHGIAPVCIGSHYAVRTTALRQVGGIGPELAEDFSTTFLLTSSGWQGAFAHRARANGEGPHTFAAMVVQEFQWSRSLVVLLLGLAPRHLVRMPWRLRARFAFALLYYPLFAVMTGVGLLLPPAAALTGHGWLSVNYLEFLLRWGVASACLLAIHLRLRARGLMRPRDAPVVSWEQWLYVLAKWPYVARGVLAAVAQRIWPRPVRFVVTPKHRDGLEGLAARLVLPYVAISLVASGSALVGQARTSAAVGYVFLCLLAATAYAVVSIAVPALHAREAARQAGVALPVALARTAAAPLTLALLTLVPLTTAVVTYPGYVAGVLGWAPPVDWSRVVRWALP
jgi:cellulose synthase/poly-beta-1,6-N-acetylglucosamine synthase-like glycosyltransferase